GAAGRRAAVRCEVPRLAARARAGDRRSLTPSRRAFARRAARAAAGIPPAAPRGARRRVRGTRRAARRRPPRDARGAAAPRLAAPERLVEQQYTRRQRALDPREQRPVEIAHHDDDIEAFRRLRRRGTLEVVLGERHLRAVSRGERPRALERARIDVPALGTE